MNIVETPLNPLPLATLTSPAVATIPAVRPLRQTLADLAALTKARLTLMVLFTVAIGYLMASGGQVNGWIMTNVLLGTALVAAGASALNQLLERDADAAMVRTRNRPLPAGRMSPGGALRFGVVSACAGLGYLAIGVNPVAALVAAVTLLTYVLAYTPLKTRTGLNTFVGAIPGALPPIIGWSAATGRIEPEAWSLFLILFLWQFPHFWAIAWLYKEDYARAGMKMVPIQDTEGGKMTGRLMMQNCLVLLLASWTPVAFGMAGPRYGIVAVAMGVVFLAMAIRFWHRPSRDRSRHVLWASLVYLPVTFMVMLVDGPFLLWVD